MDIYKYIKSNNTLNPKLWNGFVLKDDIKEKIQTIAEFFIDKLQENDVYILVKDIYILGSNAGYNYNIDSDLDVHIMVDTTATTIPFEYLNRIYMMYRSLFKNVYNPTIEGIPVELYIEPYQRSNNASEGVYSLNEGWLKKPKQETLKVNAEETNSLYSAYIKEFKDLMEKISLENVDYQIYEIDNFINKIYDLRKTNLTIGGEFNSGNIVFKELRARGYIDTLRELKVKLENQKLTM